MHTYDGSTATGIPGIQFAKLFGARVAITCSPCNFSLVKSLGADAAVDYLSPIVSADIKACDNNTIAHAWDWVVTVDSTIICSATIGDAGGQYHALLPFDAEVIKAANPNVKGGNNINCTSFDEDNKTKKARYWPCLRTTNIARYFES